MKHAFVLESWKELNSSDNFYQGQRQLSSYRAGLARGSHNSWVTNSAGSTAQLIGI
jgi:hypothetical protein